ncbi:MAG: hypothetical protein IJU66_01615 [Oscillospiraceae bacterium]|nr:hypothetical protein [Oscillospiraceae bacterium]
MEAGGRSVEVRLDAEMFREFAVFDGLLRQRRWLRIALFALFFCALAALAFYRAQSVEGAALLAVGLGLPAVYLAFFLRSVNLRARRVDPREIVYTLTLGGDWLGVKKGEQSTAYEWKKLHAAYRLRRCVCLYVDPSRAFLAPDETGGIWRLVSAAVEQKRLHDRTRGE